MGFMFYHHAEANSLHSTCCEQQVLADHALLPAAEGNFQLLAAELL
jgi:hypothetical protein